jgi:hypothetical protein
VALEAVLRIRAQDDTAPALAEIKKRIGDVEKTIGQLDKFVSSVSKVTRATDPLASSLLSAEKALSSGRSEISAMVAALDRVVGPTDRAAAAQRNLARSVETTASAFARQGQAAMRASERATSAGRSHGGGAHGGGAHGGLVGVLPFAGPALEHGAAKFIEAGATTEEEIARLKALGASPGDIDRARGDWRALSKQYAGLTEIDYLAGYRNARVVAPGEAFEMARLGAKYKLALRNSGLSASEYDVENVMKIMDEQGLKTPESREDDAFGLSKFKAKHVQLVREVSELILSDDPSGVRPTGRNRDHDGLQQLGRGSSITRRTNGNGRRRLR